MGHFVGILQYDIYNKLIGFDLKKQSLAKIKFLFFSKKIFFDHSVEKSLERGDHFQASIFFLSVRYPGEWKVV